MKKKITLITILLLCAVSIFAQVPEKFSYQAVVRDANNSLVVNAQVVARVNILQGSASGNALYSESHVTSSNANGLITLNIGDGYVLHGSFASIDWSDGPYFLKTDIDPNGGNDYSITTVQQLLSVPYALYANEAANGFSGDYNDLTNKPQIPQSVGELTNDANYITAGQIPAQVNADWNATSGAAEILNKPVIPVVPTNVSAFNNDAGYLTSYTEQQILTISHDTIFLTGGSFVKLPTVGGSDTTGMAALLAQLEQLQRPSVSTLSVSNVSYHGAYVTGRLFNSGTSWISGCGFCWSTAQNPTLANNHLTATNDLGTFGLNLTGLADGTTYYVRAYATNSAGTTYGEQLSFTTISTTLPTVTTNTVSNITSTAATCGGNVTLAGGATVTARGVCWSTSQNPTTSNSHTSDGSGTGSFTSLMNGLTSNTTYYVRAYATNSQGTAYGEQKSFTTANSGNPNDGQPCPGHPTVTDHEGNVYNTVQIGDQCWTKENLRTTTSPSTGTYLIPASSANYTYTGKQARWYNNDSATYAPQNYGLLYNWNAAVDTFNTSFGETSVNTSRNNAVFVTFNGYRRGICPAGWHLPSDAEWTLLTDYVSSQGEYTCGGVSYNIAKALASTSLWYEYSYEPCCVGNDQSTNNATGFSAVPVGIYYESGYASSFSYPDRFVYFWSSTEYEYEYFSGAWCRGLGCDSTTVYRITPNKSTGSSVRCLRDSDGGGGSSATLPTVTTGTVSNITATTATCGGNVTADGGSSVTARGVCWSTSQNPTVSSNHTTDGSGTGSFTSNIAGLTAGTTYYVRAYAVNSVGTAYGNEVSFTTTPIDTTTTYGIPCPNMPTVTDHEGNVYNTVQIGDQCWMRENLRTTTSPSTGTYLIPAVNAGITETGKQARWYNNDSATYAPMNYGLLYNWNAAMDTFNTAYGETSVNANYANTVLVTFVGHRRGICPEGWHVPSDAEWFLANNVAVFSAVLAGSCRGSSFSGAGDYAAFWSTTVMSNGDAYDSAFYWGFSDNSTYMFAPNTSKYYGYSVRCLRDSDGGGYSITLPTVTTDSVSNITVSSATCGGNVISDGGATVTARGVCWSIYPNPIVENDHTTEGSGMGSFASNITGLIPNNTTYYVRAYATNGVYTAYGNEFSFTTASVSSAQDGQPCSGTPTVTDYDGNVYNTVQVGNQCWMRENLRTKHFADGSTIPAGGSNTSSIEPYYYNYSSSSIPLSERGYLYNWAAVMHGAASSSAVPSGVQGICPTGWHVPSEAEWTTLKNYVISVPDYQCGGNLYYITKALASTTGWNTSTNNCAAGNNQSANNATGFSAVPAGYHGSSFNYTGRRAYFWSSTEYGSYAYESILYYDSAVMGSYHDNKSNGASVRCLRDGLIQN